MAMFQIAPPEQFNFNQSDEWSKWIHRFERFRDVSRFSEKDEVHQVNTLVYCMGDAADDILCLLGLTNEEKKVYAMVKTKFESHFVKRRKVIFERCKFNQRKQEKGKSVDSFITPLHGLAEHCNYGALRNEIIRDRIVVGLSSSSISMKLQTDSELTLEKATALARQHESVVKQQETVRGEQRKPPSIDAMESRKQGERKSKRPQNRSINKHFSTGQTPARQLQKQVCTRCCKTPSHGKQHCPAREAICHKCSKRGYYQSMCKTSKLAQVETQSDEESVFKQLKDVTLVHSDCHLSGPSQYQLQVSGKFTATLKFGTKEAKENIFVVQKLQKALLGRPGIESLNLLARINTLQNEMFVTMYPNLFKGLGTIAGEYCISLQEGAKPFAISTPRRIPLPLKPKYNRSLREWKQWESSPE